MSMAGPNAAKWMLPILALILSVALWLTIPSIEISLESILPQYFRSFALVVMAVWLWIWTVNSLSNAGIQIHILLKSPSDDSRELVRLAGVLSGLLVVSIIFFNSTDYKSSVVTVSSLGILFVLYMPTCSPPSPASLPI